MDLDVRNDAGSRSPLFEVFLHLDRSGLILNSHYHTVVIYNEAGFTMLVQLKFLLVG